MFREQLIDTLRSIRVPCVISITHESTPSMLKTNNPYLEVIRQKTVTGQINFSYEGQMNEEMPEGFKNFKAGPRVWGQRIKHCPLIEHKGKLYLEMLPTEELPASYFLNDVEVKPEAVEKFLKDKKPTMEGLVRPKDFSVIGITQIKIWETWECITDI